MRALPSIAVLTLLSACGGASDSFGLSAPQALAAGPGQAQATTLATADPALVIEGTVHISVNTIAGALDAIRTAVAASEGRIVNESESGAGLSWSARMVVRVPPAKVDSLLATVGKLGTITSKNIGAEDVGKTLLDQEIALTNLQTTLDRMRALLSAPNLSMADILEIEREMTRLRGEIESIKGSQRFLVDRVAFATLTFALSRDGGAELDPSAKLFPGPRLSALVLLRPGERDRTRLGGGATIQFPGPGRFSLELDVFERADSDDSAALIATAGGAIYSDFLGRGKRSSLNPYVGVRVGYGYLDSSRFVIAADTGVELLKTRRVLIDANLRTTALIGEQSDVGLVFGLSGVVAF